MTTVALVGCGGMGITHLNAYMTMTDLVKVSAIVDGNVERAKQFAEIFGANIYSSMEQLLENEKPDVIDICLPTYLHAKYGIMSLNHGCHTMIEKPVCLSEKEAVDLLEAKKKSGKFVQVGQVLRFEKCYTSLIDAIRSGTYGKVKSAFFRRLTGYPWWSKDLTDYTKCGSVAMDLHIHDADFIQYVFGDPNDLVSHAVRDKNGVVQHITTIYDYGNYSVTAEAGWDYPDTFEFTAEYYVNFENALFEYKNDRLKIYQSDRTFEINVSEKQFGKLNANINFSDILPFVSEIRYFIDSVEGREDGSRASLESAVASFRLVQEELRRAGGVKI